MTTFQSNAQVYLAIEEPDNKKLIEWSGPIPGKSNFIRFIDGDEVIPLLVLNVEWVAIMTGDFEDGLVAPSEIYIHAKQWTDKSTLRESEVEPAIVSAETHPVHGRSHLEADPTYCKRCDLFRPCLCDEENDQSLDASRSNPGVVKPKSERVLGE